MMPRDADWFEITKDEKGKTVFLVRTSPEDLEEYPLWEGLSLVQRKLEQAHKHMNKLQEELDEFSQHVEDIGKDIREALAEGLIDEDDLADAHLQYLAENDD